MGKQMEGDNRQRRKAAAKAREAGQKPSEFNMTTGASKQRTHIAGDEDRVTKLQTTQKDEAKQAGRDVPKPLRGKGRGKEPLTPPKPGG